MSKFVDSFRLTDESGGGKKEIVFNLGDITAREWADKAKRTASDAKNIANEAMALVNNSSNGVINSVVRWTTSDKLNTFLSGVEVEKVDYSVDIEQFSFWCPNPLYDVIYVRYEGNTVGLAEIPSGGGRVRVLASVDNPYGGYSQVIFTFTFLHAIDKGNDTLDSEEFKLNKDVIRYRRFIGSPYSDAINYFYKDYTDRSDAEYAQMVVDAMNTLRIAHNSNNYVPSIVYRKSGDTSFRFDSQIPDRIDQDVEDIIEAHCEGIANLTEWLADAYIITATGLTGINNANYGYNGMAGMFEGKRLIKAVSFAPNNYIAHLNASSMFRDTPKLKSVDLSGLDVGFVESLSFMFGRSGVKKVVIPSKWNIGSEAILANVDFMFAESMIEELDFQPSCKNVRDTLNMFERCVWLRKFSGLKDIKVSYSLGSCPLLSQESAHKCIEALYDLTEGGTSNYEPQFITFHSAVFAHILDEYIAMAESKGWYVVAGDEL